MANNTLRVKIQDFRGETSENATEWLHSFDLVVNHYINVPHFVPPGGNAQAPAPAQGGNAQAQAQQLAQAQANEVLFQFSAHLKGKALQWYLTQTAVIRQDYAQLRAAFVARYVNGDPHIMLESQLHNLKLENSDVDSYVAQMLELGRKLNRTADSLTGSFLMGLNNDSLRQYVMGTDNHTIDNYRQRAKLFLSANPTTAVSPVATATANSDPTLIALLQETTAAVRDMSLDFRQSRSEYRSRSNQNKSNSDRRSRYDQNSHSDRRSRYDKSPYRSQSRSPFRSRERPERPRSNSRNRYDSNTVTFRPRTRSPTPYRDREIPGEGYEGCWVCGGLSHFAKHCRDKRNRQGK